MYDQRLFNQTQGVTSGFGDEEAYDLYDKPLFSGSAANAIYRPRKTTTSGSAADNDDFGGDDTGDQERVRQIIDRKKGGGGFSGSKDAPERDGPIQFEKEANIQQQQQDPFGLDAFLSKASSSSSTPTKKRSRPE